MRNIKGKFSNFPLNIPCVDELVKGYDQPLKDALAYSLSRVYNCRGYNRPVSAPGDI